MLHTYNEREKEKQQIGAFIQILGGNIQKQSGNMQVNYKNQSSAAILERVKQAKTEYRISVKRLAEHAGLNHHTVQNQLQGKYKLDIDVLSAIMELCPNLSAEWIIRGNSSQIEQRLERLEKEVFKNKIAK